MNDDVLAYLRQHGRLGEALAHILGRTDLPLDQTSEIRCLNPAGHLHGDENPSAVFQPEVGRVACKSPSCGRSWGIFDAAVTVGWAPTKADAATKLKAWIGSGFAGNGAASGNGKPGEKKKAIDYASWSKRAADFLRGKLAAGKLPRLEEFRAAFNTLGVGIVPKKDEHPPAFSVPICSPAGAVIGMKLRKIGDLPGEKSKTIGKTGLMGLPSLARLPDALVAIAAGEKDLIDGQATVPEWAWISACGEGLSLKAFRGNVKGRNLVLFYDADQAGKNGAAKIAAELAGAAASVKIAEIPLPGTPDRKDLSDLLGETPDDEAASLLRKLAEQAREYDGPSETAPATEADPDLILDPGDPLPTAIRFVHDHHERGGVRTIHHHKGEFVIWTGAHYPSTEESSMRARLYPWLASASHWKKIGKNMVLVPFKPTTEKVSGVLDALRAASYLPADVSPPAWLPPATGPNPETLVACRNGILDLETGALLPHDPRYFTKNAIDIDYDPKAPSPDNWLKFLCDLWPSDSDAIYTLGEWLGYLLSADTRQQKILLLVGPRRSGKGTILRVLTALAGQASVTSPSLTKLSLPFGEQSLIDKRIALVTDLRLGARTDQAAVAEKLLSISGGDPITIPRKFLPDWIGYPSVRFVVASNELPRIADTSGALASRFILLPLTESFLGREDPLLFDKLLPEIPGILNFAVEGYQRLRDRGHFEQPASGRDALQSLENLASPVGAFVRDFCEVGPACEAPKDAIWDAWKSWCEQNGRDRPGTKATFGRDLLSVIPGLQDAQRTQELTGKRYRVYVGLRIRKNDEGGER